MSKRVTRWFKTISVAVAASLALAACAASTVTGKPSFGNAPNVDLKVRGVDSSSSFDQAVQNSLSDIVAFWQTQYGKVSNGKSLPPIKGGLYSVDGRAVAISKTVTGPAAQEGCVQRSGYRFIVDNGAFCGRDDSIIWDRAKTHLLAQLASRYGDLLVAMIFAHEFGHAISFRLGFFDKATKLIQLESQADCAAGAWMASAIAGANPHFRDVTPAKIDDALEGYLDARDSTPGTIDEISHGNGFDRLSAIADGLQFGVKFCYSDSYLNRTFTERPFTDPKDYNLGGNEPLSEVLKTGADNSFVIDLNNFWAAEVKNANSSTKTFQPVKISETSSPTCSGAKPSELFYCPDNNTVFYNRSFAAAAYNSLPDIKIAQGTADVTLLFKQPADFSLGALFAMSWGMAVRHQVFNRSLDDSGALLAAVCYTGAYSKDNNVASDPSETNGIILSPADLDEAVSALLNNDTMARSFGERGTTGLQRIQAFTKGYKDGLNKC